MLKSLDMKICIFCPKDSVAAAKLKTEVESRGHTCRRMRISDLFIDLTNGKLEVKHRKHNLEDFDIFIFRKISQAEGEIVAITAKYLEETGKRVLDSESLRSNNFFFEFDKLSAAKIPLLKRVITTSIKSSRDVLMDLAHPVIVKPLDLPKERYTYSEDWTESYDIVRTEKSKKYEFIEVPDTNSFIKVYIVGNKYIGALLKENIDSEKKLNLAKKIKTSKIEIGPEVIAQCESAARAMGYFACSLDLVQTEEGFKTIEIDRAPVSGKFNKLFEKNFESFVVDYLETLQ